MSKRFSQRRWGCDIAQIEPSAIAKSPRIESMVTTVRSRNFSDKETFNREG